MGKRGSIFGLAVLLGLGCVFPRPVQGQSAVAVGRCADAYQATRNTVQVSATQMPWESDLRASTEALLDPLASAWTSIRTEPKLSFPVLCSLEALADLDAIVTRLKDLGYPISAEDQARSRIQDIRLSQRELTKAFLMPACKGIKTAEGCTVIETTPPPSHRSVVNAAANDTPDRKQGKN